MMKRILTCLLALTTLLALTAPAYADAIAASPEEEAASLAAILLVGLVIAVTAWLLVGLGNKKK